MNVSILHEMCQSKICYKCGVNQKFLKYALCKKCIDEKYKNKCKVCRKNDVFHLGHQHGQYTKCYECIQVSKEYFNKKIEEKREQEAEEATRKRGKLITLESDDGESDDGESEEIKNKIVINNNSCDC